MLNAFVKYTTVYGVSLTLAATRILGHTSVPFQAVAHLWVGSLFGVWLVRRNRVFLDAVIAMGSVELVCFFALGHQ